MEDENEEKSMAEKVLEKCLPKTSVDADEKIKKILG